MQVVREHREHRESDAPPSLLGVARSAAAEIIVFYAAALVLDALVLDGTRFRDLTPHPFWLFILVVAAHYGTAAGVFAAVLGTLLAFMGNLPPRDLLDDQTAYLVLVLGKPVLWFGSAVVLGELRTRRARVEAVLRDRVAELEGSRDELAAERKQLAATCERLQASAAGQVQTTVSLLQAARCVETQDPREVFASVDGLIVALMSPAAYSIYLHDADGLQLATRKADAKTPAAQRRYGQGTRLYQTIVKDRSVVHVATPEGQQVLGRDGVIAGPLLDDRTGEVVGMLRIEGLPLTMLRDDSLHTFCFLCAWIGTAYRNAQRFAAAHEARIARPGSPFFSHASHPPVARFLVALAERAHFDVSQLTIRITHESVRTDTGHPTAAESLGNVVASALRSTDLAFDCQETRGEYLVLLPMTPPEHCQMVADRIRDLVRERLGEHDHEVRIFLTFESLYSQAKEASKPVVVRPIVRLTAPAAK